MSNEKSDKELVALMKKMLKNNKSKSTRQKQREVYNATLKAKLIEMIEEEKKKDEC